MGRRVRKAQSAYGPHLVTIDGCEPLSHRDLQIVRPECESSCAGIVCDQLLVVCTAERRGWHWPANKDARRWPVRWLPRWPKAYLNELNGGSQGRALD